MLTRGRCSRCWLVVVLLALALAAGAQESSRVLRLHPDLPETLDRAWIERLGLFPDLPDLERATFSSTAWGGVVARLETPTRTLERNLHSIQVRALDAMVAAALAGEPVPPWPDVAPPITSGRAWPETAAPPAAPVRELSVARQLVPIEGHWLAMVELGSRLDVTGFNEYFGPQAQIGVAFAHAVVRQVVPALGFYAGFGDMRSDFEDGFGDGRANTFGFVLNLQLRAPLTRRHSLYLEGSGGYHIRSLYWGSAFIDPATGRVREGRALEQSDLGWGLRVGWQLASHAENRPRLFDVGVGVHTMPADQWFFATETAMFEASERDTWVMLTFRLWDGL